MAKSDRPCRTSHWIDSRCFKVLQISNWKRPCLRGSKGLLKLFPSTNPVMNSISSSSSTREISKLNMESNKDSKSSSKMVRAHFFWFCFHVIGCNGSQKCQYWSNFCPSVVQVFRGMNSKCSPKQSLLKGTLKAKSAATYEWMISIWITKGLYLEAWHRMATGMLPGGRKWIALGYTGSYWVIYDDIWYTMICRYCLQFLSISHSLGIILPVICLVKMLQLSMSLCSSFLQRSEVQTQQWASNPSSHNPRCPQLVMGTGIQEATLSLFQPVQSNDARKSRTLS